MIGTDAAGLRNATGADSSLRPAYNYFTTTGQYANAASVRRWGSADIDGRADFGLGFKSAVTCRIRHVSRTLGPATTVELSDISATVPNLRKTGSSRRPATASVDGEFRRSNGPPNSPTYHQSGHRERGRDGSIAGYRSKRDDSKKGGLKRHATET